MSERRAPANREYLESKALAENLDAAVKALQSARLLSTKPTEEDHIHKALLAAGKAQKTARARYKDLSLKHAPQAALFEGDEALQEAGEALDRMEAGS